VSNVITEYGLFYSFFSPVDACNFAIPLVDDSLEHFYRIFFNVTLGVVNVK